MVHSLCKLCVMVVESLYSICTSSVYLKLSSPGMRFLLLGRKRHPPRTTINMESIPSKLVIRKREGTLY